MNNLLVLRSVKDHQVNDLLNNHFGYIKENFDTILMESVSCQKVNRAALEWYQQVIATYKVDLSGVPDFPKEHAATLMRSYAQGEDIEAFLDKRIEVFQIFIDRIVPNPFLNQLYTQLLEAKFYSRALAEGIELRGCEPANYIPERTPIEVREGVFINTLRECAQKGKRVYANFVWSHGLPLLKAFMETPLPTKTVMLHLNVNPDFYYPDSDLNQWKTANTVALPHLKLVTVQKSDVHQPLEAFAIRLEDNQNPKEHYKYALVLYKHQRYTDAVIHLNYAKDLFTDPSDKASCYSTLASCYRELGDTAKAEEACVFALSLDPEDKLRESIQKKLDALQ